MVNEDIIKSHLDFIKNERGLSDNTIITYKTNIYIFNDLYGKSFIDCIPF